jgi:hypothetical protein
MPYISQVAMTTLFIATEMASVTTYTTLPTIHTRNGKESLHGLCLERTDFILRKKQKLLPFFIEFCNVSVLLVDVSLSKQRTPIIKKSEICKYLQTAEYQPFLKFKIFYIPLHKLFEAITIV